MQAIHDDKDLHKEVMAHARALYDIARQSGQRISVYASPKEYDPESGDFMNVFCGDWMKLINEEATA